MKCADRLTMTLVAFDEPPFVSQFLQIDAFTIVLVVRVVQKIVSPSCAWKETVPIVCFGASPRAERFQHALTTIRVRNWAVGLMILAPIMQWRPYIGWKRVVLGYGRVGRRVMTASSTRQVGHLETFGSHRRSCHNVGRTRCASKGLQVLSVSFYRRRSAFGGMRHGNERCETNK